MTIERYQQSHSDTFTVNCSQFSIIALSLLLSLNMFSLTGSASVCGLPFGQVQWCSYSADSLHDHRHFLFLEEGNPLFSRKQGFIKPWWNSWKTSEKGLKFINKCSLHINLIDSAFSARRSHETERWKSITPVHDSISKEKKEITSQEMATKVI